MVSSPTSPPEMIRLFSLKRVLGNTCFSHFCYFCVQYKLVFRGHDCSQLLGESRLSEKEGHMAIACPVQDWHLEQTGLTSVSF